MRNTFFLTQSYYWLKFIVNYKIVIEAHSIKGETKKDVISCEFQAIINSLLESVLHISLLGKCRDYKYIKFL